MSKKEYVSTILQFVNKVDSASNKLHIENVNMLVDVMIEQSRTDVLNAWICELKSKKEA